MPRGLRKKSKQYVLDQFQEEDPEAFFKFKMKSTHGLSPEQMDFLQAVEYASSQKVKVMLGRGVDPNFYVVPKRQTPLHFAVGYKPNAVAAEKMVGLMLFFGADPNAQDNLGRTPLHAACVSGRFAIVELLLQAGADANLCDNRHESPLLTACSHVTQDSVHIVKMLLNNGAHVSCVNDFGQTALHKLTSPEGVSTTTTSVRAEVGQMLLEHGLCANHRDNRGVCPLSQELMIMSGQPMTLTDPCLAMILVCAGATVDSQILCEQKTNMYTAVSNVLQQLDHVMPRSHLTDLLRHIREQTSSRPDQTTELVDGLEQSLSKVLSLAQLCRITVRSALGGHVISGAHNLPLPEKMKHYIYHGELDNVMFSLPILRCSCKNLSTYQLCCDSCVAMLSCSCKNLTNSQTG